MNLASAWKGIKQRINWALNKSEHLSVPERQKQREIKSAKQIAIVESALIELEEIKKRAEEKLKYINNLQEVEKNMPNGWSVEQSVIEVKDIIGYILKGETK